MRNNIGKIDRFLRIVVGGLLVLIFLNGTLVGLASVISLAVAAIMIITAILGTCPLYTVARCNTSEY